MSLKADSSLVKHVRPAANFGLRRGVRGIDMLLLHYTGMQNGPAAMDWLCGEESGVSCHYFIDEAGTISQLVAEEKRAHHAGAGCWEGDDDTNSRSIGIEIVNGGHEFGLPDFPPAQMRSVAALAADIIARHAIEPKRVLAHSDIAPGRKLDPGEKFDWAWLAGKNVGHWVAPTPQTSGPFLQHNDEGDPVAALQGMLVMYGYHVPQSGQFCDRTRVVVEAFQRHFRPERVDGVADVSTVDTLHALLRDI